MTSRAVSSNLQTVRTGYDDFAAGDMDAVLSFFADDIEWVVADGFPFGGTYVGPDEVRSGVFEQLGEQMAVFDVIPERFVDAGDTIVVLGEYDGVDRETGNAFTGVPWAHVWDFRDGTAVRFQQYTDTALVQDALTA
ncbi:nuclear transport factor 2 family protein [Halobacteriaceae archaeon GCM10025711]